MFGRKVQSTLPPAPPDRHREAPAPAAAAAAGAMAADPPEPAVADRDPLERLIREKLFSRINVSAAVTTGRGRLHDELVEIVAAIASGERLPINAAEQEQIVTHVLDDMFGLGPLEPLLADETITDIMVNGPHQVYVERHGKLELTDCHFRDDAHATNVAQRIAASVGRRVDESSPTVDARLPDGSRVNIVLPPVALNGCVISIRKFAKRKVDFAQMVRQDNLSSGMAKLLEIAAACRLNIVISGGTGSGKTTLLNALSRMIDSRERVLTIEDAAELQLQQPHVVSLETRPVNVEGHGEINQRDLVKNALRMRPDRIILGETRGSEAFDVLQAMNTGHDGSMTTVHANTPRDALIRLENMVLMSNANLPIRAIRMQIAGAVNLVVQIERMRDGVRRIQSITEVIGMEGDVITTQDLFTFEYDATSFGDKVNGTFVGTGVRPHFSRRAAYYGLEEALMAAMKTP
ncbi:CpaF family protein [Azospirillum picis]|uniref:Pilus assembly protein CpaF n=1 Tax=Azospirillum picis TaxID=488438 RepID=A0ABU0MN72_9PROT|nr:CpaF family protein [Azospirillum picis]MBP2301110.1 pilus assembly protein CpaF [Azospirillum picis]MDQ0534928.1 pilus assembly protein CpaF [Azospirillum picis]